MQPIRQSKEYQFGMKYLFPRQIISNIVDIEYNQILYISNTLKLVVPILMTGKTAFYSFTQLAELKLIKNLKDKYFIPFSKIKKAKDVLKQINEDLDLSDKNVIYAYGEIFYLNNFEMDKKLIHLTNKHNGQQTLIVKIAMSDIVKEIDEKAKEVINFADYKLKKTYTTNMKIV